MAEKIVNVRLSSGNLNFKTVQKIIDRFLTCERIKLIWMMEELGVFVWIANQK